MLVRHVMSSELFALPADTPVLEALRALRRRKIRRAPILDEDGGLLGFVTERDLLRVIPGSVKERESFAGHNACTRSVVMVAAKTVTVAHPDDHIEDLARLFLAHKIGGVPVVSDERVVGMITESDIFRAVVGAAHLRDAMRVTVQRSHAPRYTPVLDVVESLDLDLAGLTEYPGPDGRDVIVVRVRGARSEELGQKLVSSGWVMLDRRPSSHGAQGPQLEDSDLRAAG
ncbi:MAG: acetoin utilization protein AcuB [Planctomycetota bacterium]|jgi:acetoin utilization protein AcuB